MIVHNAGLVKVLLGTPDTSFRGLRTRKVLSMERSGPAAFPSSDFGINIGRNLKQPDILTIIITFIYIIFFIFINYNNNFPPE